MANDIIAKIEREYALTRRKNADNLRKRQDIANSDPEFLSISKQIKALNFEIAKTEEFYGDKQKAASLREQKRELAQLRTKALLRLGLNEGDLTIKYDCPLCRDSGFTDGTPCTCFNEKYKRFTLSELSISPVPELSFADDTAKKPEKLAKTYNILHKYVDKFPDVNTRNFLFSGKTGCGKTHLASIVCGELSQKGFNCVFLTATEINQLFLKLHTTKLSERPDYMGILISCDFLVIDDLGTENIYNNVTAEYFLTLISERLAKKRHTIITTNLTSNEIMLRYNERFFSRVTEKRSSAQIIFEDVNFRAQKM